MFKNVILFFVNIMQRALSINMWIFLLFKKLDTRAIILDVIDTKLMANLIAPSIATNPSTRCTEKYINHKFN